MDSVHRPFIGLFDSPGMTPWQVIEEALLRKRPARNMKWLADELDENIQTVSNWKARGVPARRYREIGKVLGLSVDQIEGLEPPPWEIRPAVGLLPEVVSLAQSINDLPEQQRKLVLEQARLMVSYTSELLRASTQEAERDSPKQDPSPERLRKSR